MGLHFTSDKGAAEAIIDDNCGISKFYAIANFLSEDLQVNFLNQIDDAESLLWDFKYKENLLTLHFSIFNGVSISHQQMNNLTGQNNAVLEVAYFLKQKAF
jgi:hypothetical protein